MDFRRRKRSFERTERSFDPFTFFIFWCLPPRRFCPLSGGTFLGASCARKFHILYARISKKAKETRVINGVNVNLAASCNAWRLEWKYYLNAANLTHIYIRLSTLKTETKRRTIRNARRLIPPMSSLHFFFFLPGLQFSYAYPSFFSLFLLLFVSRSDFCTVAGRKPCHLKLSSFCSSFFFTVSSEGFRKFRCKRRKTIR